MTPQVRKLAVWLLLLLLGGRAIYATVRAEGEGWDFTNYYATGLRIYYGEWQNIYKPHSLIRGNPPPKDGTFDQAGFPLSTLAFAPLGALSRRAAMLALKTADLICLILAFHLLYRHFRRLARWRVGRELSVPVFLAAILFCEPAWRVFSVGGQSTPLAFLFAVLFYDRFVNERPWSAAVALSLAILFKPFLGVALLIFVAAGYWMFSLRLICSLSILGAVSMGVMGTPLHWEWLQVVAFKSQLRFLPWVYNASLISFATNFWQSGGPMKGTAASISLLKIILMATRLAVTACMAWLAWISRDSNWTDTEKRQWIAGLALAFALCFSSVVWTHYLLFLYPIFFWLHTRLPKLRPGSTWLLAGAVLATLRSNQRVTLGLLSGFLKANSLFGVLVAGAVGTGTLWLVVTLLIAERPRKFVSQSESDLTLSVPAEVEV